MRAALGLELELYRQQQSAIARALDSPSAAFKAYEARYRQRTRTAGTVIERADVECAVTEADITYVGDYHTLRAAQQSYLSLVQAAMARGRRPVVMALEAVEGRHQAKVDAFLARRLSEDGLRRALGHSKSGEFDLWEGFRPLFLHAREHGLEIVGIDRRAPGERSLQMRDLYAANRLVQVLRRPERPRVLTLMGQYHVTPCHLPARVRDALGAPARKQVKDLVVYQNCEGVYWALAKRGLHGSVEAVHLRPGELCLMNASPVLCQQSFLDYLESESGDSPLSERAAGERFRELASLVGRFVGVDVGKAVADVEVVTAADLPFIEQLRRRGKLTPRELESVRKQVLSRESYYVPRAQVAYLASFSLNHAAEEATHFVRHCCVGAAMDAPRRAEDAFYARCLEEALGFFGSRLVNPQRPCVGLAGWAEAFRSRKGEERHIAAFVLAHKAAEAQGTEHARKILPLHPDRLFNAVTHGLGYLLGDALHRAFLERRIKTSRLRSLFRDPFAQPAEAYFELLGEVTASTS